MIRLTHRKVSLELIYHSYNYKHYQHIAYVNIFYRLLRTFSSGLLCFCQQKLFSSLEMETDESQTLPYKTFICNLSGEFEVCSFNCNFTLRFYKLFAALPPYSFNTVIHLKSHLGVYQCSFYMGKKIVPLS